MKKFEYGYSICEERDSIFEMNERGKNGWEVISIDEVENSSELKIFYKREIIDKESTDKTSQDTA